MPAGKDTVIIGIGEYQVGSMPMASIGLGSCVGLVIHDRQTGTGALVHIMLPSSQGKTETAREICRYCRRDPDKRIDPLRKLAGKFYSEDCRRFSHVQNVFR